MKIKLLLLSSLALLIALAPVNAMSAEDTIQGKVETYTCILENKSCAKGPNDPVAMAEDCFVVLLPDGKYYFVVNVDCKFMARLVTQTIKVNGTKDPKYDAIKADTIELIQDGKSRVIFNRASEFNPPPKIK